jgi:signal transduction histidine kinase
MNQMWVRISLTYIVIVIFLFIVPSVVYLTIRADEISPGYYEITEGSDQALNEGEPTLYQRIMHYPRKELVLGLLRTFLSISLVGILVGIVSSRGLAAPLRNLAEAAKAVGSQDLSQRLEIKGTDEVREVAIAFNAMAAALEEAEGLRNNMLADIAHELRTPLTVIQGNLRAILDDVYELDKVEVARLYDQTRQLSRLVDDLHDLSLLEAKQFSLDFTSINMNDLVQDVAAIYSPIFEDSGTSLSLDLPDKTPVIEGDCARITQCINNLLNNALRHTSAEGEVTIQVSEDGERVSLSVIDDGVGIDQEHLPYVFDRFYRVDPDRNRRTGGSGLGLAITHALVMAHGGKITAASEGKDLGSSFTIQLANKITHHTSGD